MVNSTTDCVEAFGALTTIIPAEPADSKSILSTPTPARPMTFKPLLATIISEVNFVALRR